MICSWLVLTLVAQVNCDPTEVCNALRRDIRRLEGVVAEAVRSAVSATAEAREVATIAPPLTVSSTESATVSSTWASSAALVRSGTATGVACPPCPDLEALQQLVRTLLQAVLTMKVDTKSLPEGDNTLWWRVFGMWERSWSQLAGAIFLSWACYKATGTAKIGSLACGLFFSPHLTGLLAVSMMVRGLVRCGRALHGSWLGRRCCPAQQEENTPAAEVAEEPPQEAASVAGSLLSVLSNTATVVAAGAGQAAMAAVQAPVNLTQYVRSIFWDRPLTQAHII